GVDSAYGAHASRVGCLLVAHEPATLAYAKRMRSIVWIRPRLLGRSRCGFARWHNPEHEGRNLFPGFERTGNLAADRVQTLEKSRDRHGVIRCECRKSVPRHDRRQEAAVRPVTGRYRHKIHYAEARIMPHG